MTHITPNQQNTHFRLCTFNLLNYNAPPNACYETDNIYTNEQWQRKERWIDLYLGLMQGDVVGFQEVFSPESLADLTRKQGYDHFATVEKPRKGRDHIYHKPVVAIASRFPILSCKTINLSKTSKIKSGLSSQFRFSRAPLKAEVFIENFGQCLVYVVHLKSSRPSLEPPLFEQSESWQKVAAQSMLRQAQGYWNSLKQRGNEAMLLYQDVVREVLKRDRPVVLLGDFNTSINAETLRQLVEAREIRELNKTPRQSLNVEAQRQIRRFSLYDAFDLQNKVGVDARKNTHYFLNRGSVLDYVLLSKDFDQAYDHSLASVVSYEVFDRHLQNPEYAIDSQCSDHAPVVVELEVRQ
jgi:endonuclease/exonuclease/phosphatase family metal-dependent hydrolase